MAPCSESCTPPIRVVPLNSGLNPTTDRDCIPQSISRAGVDLDILHDPLKAERDAVSVHVFLFFLFRVELCLHNVCLNVS